MGHISYPMVTCNPVVQYVTEFVLNTKNVYVVTYHLESANELTILLIKEEFLIVEELTMIPEKTIQPSFNVQLLSSSG